MSDEQKIKLLEDRTLRLEKRLNDIHRSRLGLSILGVRNILGQDTEILGDLYVRGDITSEAGSTVGGVDIGAHVLDPNAHHSKMSVVDSGTIDFTLVDQQLTGIVIQSALDHGSIGGLADDDHAHYYNNARLYAEASNDVSATAVQKVLKSTAAGGLKLKQLDLTNDLTVGNNVLNVDVTSWNVGINCVPDAQFDLDVAGNLRAQGWIVGKHALQVKDAIMICHYDGAEPYETNFTGNPTGHMGQVATVSGGVSYVEGKFGKGVQVAEGTTNLVINPSFETNTTGWSVGSSNGTATIERSSIRSLFGTYSLLAKPATSTWASFISTFTIPIANGATVSASAYFYLDAESGSRPVLNFYSGGILASSSTSEKVYKDWERVTVTYTNNSGSTINAQIQIGFSNVSGDLFIEGIQSEAKSYSTPYCDGSMPGCAWTSTEHASTSTRINGIVDYGSSILNGESFSISFYVDFDLLQSRAGWFVSVFDSWSSYSAIGIGSTNVIILQSNFGGYYNTSGGVATVGIHHICAVFDNDTQSLYVDGEFKASTAIPLSSFPYGGSLIIGSIETSAQFGNYVIDDLAIFSRALTADEIRAIYESDAPIFAETSTWSWRTPTNLAWADANGLWANDANSQNAFGVCGVDGYSWGGFGLDAGDIVLGRNVAGSSAIKWDISTGKFGFYGGGGSTPQVEIGTDGKLYAGGGAIFLDTNGLTAGSGNDVLRISPTDANYRLWLGNSSPSSAPFSVKKDGTIFARGINLSTAVVTRGSAQSISNAVANGGQLIYYDTQVYVSPSSMHSTTTDNYKIFAPAKGIYEVKSSGKFGIGVGSSSFRQLAVYRYNSGGSIIGDIAADYRAATVDASTYVGVTAMLQLNAGDFIVSRAYHQYGSKLNYTPYYFSLTLIKLLE